MFIKPWNKKSERIFYELSLYGKAYAKPDPIFASNFGKKHKEIVGEFMDIATTRYRKRPDQLIFTTKPGVMVIPKPGKRGVNYHFKHFKLL